MSVTSGFFNSKNHDRMYNAIDISRIFDGIINDGVYMGVGNQFAVTVKSNLTLNVDTGRCWFNHVWVLNDAVLDITLEEGDIYGARYDAIIIKIDSSESVRAGTITVKKGTPSTTSPVKPTMTHDDYVNEYPIAYAYVNPRAQIITQEDIENVVGYDACPFVTGIIDHVSIERLMMDWINDWNTFITSRMSAFDSWSSEQTAAFLDWSETNKTAFNAFVESQTAEMLLWASGFKSSSEADIMDWFSHLQNELDANQAAHLQNQIDILAEREFKHFNELDAITVDFVYDDADNVIGMNKETTEGTASTTINTTADGNVSSIVTTLIPNEGNWKYIITSTFTKEQIRKFYQREAKE